MSKNTPRLTHKNLSNARKTLLSVVNLLDENRIPYHLEGGTLLGIVRDGDLLPWDHDVDISIPAAFADQFLTLKKSLRKLGLRMSIRQSRISEGPIQEGDLSIFKIKPIFGYYLSAIFPKHSAKVVVLDVFVKTTDSKYTYWQAKGRLMRVPKRYYVDYDTIDYQGVKLKTPNFPQDYLTEKYGNWQVTVKDWSCDRDEKTIVST
jgi:phosphorylcholine metabolism protein LicD